MSIFSAAAAAPTVTGVEILRQALYARLAKGGLPMIASNLPTGIAALENFARGSGQLSPEILVLLAKELFGGNIELSPETGLLRSANREPPKVTPQDARPCGINGWGAR